MENRGVPEAAEVTVTEVLRTKSVVPVQPVKDTRVVTAILASRKPLTRQAGEAERLLLVVTQPLEVQMLPESAVQEHLRLLAVARLLAQAVAVGIQEVLVRVLSAAQAVAVKVEVMFQVLTVWLARVLVAVGAMLLGVLVQVAPAS